MTDEPKAEPEAPSEQPDPEIYVEPPMYFWTDDPDEHRRNFVFEAMADASIDGNILIANMDAIAKWLKSGEVPKAPRKLKVVEPS